MLRRSALSTCALAALAIAWVVTPAAAFGPDGGPGFAFGYGYCHAHDYGNYPAPADYDPAFNYGSYDHYYGCRSPVFAAYGGGCCG